MEENFESDEMEEVEALEFSLSEGEINELIEKLEILKETKQSFEFDIDDNNMLVIGYDEDNEEDE